MTTLTDKQKEEYKDLYREFRKKEAEAYQARTRANDAWLACCQLSTRLNMAPEDWVVLEAEVTNEEANAAQRT